MTLDPSDLPTIQLDMRFTPGMPDPNKLKVLRNINYALLPGCGECQQGRFAPGANFGQCAANTYTHAKHVGTRLLSVHRAGRCPDFEINEKKAADIERSGFTEFVQGEV